MLHFVIYTILVEDNFANSTPTSGVCNRFGYILLYANYIIKWGGSNPVFDMQLAGGNSALALVMTVVSNLLGILIVPFSISRFIAAGIGVSVPTKELFRSMVITLLIPLILGKVNFLIVFVDPSNYNLCDI